MGFFYACDLANYKLSLTVQIIDHLVLFAPLRTVLMVFIKSQALFELENKKPSGLCKQLGFD